MLAIDLIQNLIPPLRTSDLAQTALDRMQEFKISHLPIVNEADFLGLISEADILDIKDFNQPIGNHTLSLSFQSVQDSQHIYDVMRLISEQGLTALPVINKQNQYMGMVTMKNLVHYFAKLTGVDNPGGIIILELVSRDYSLAEIAQYVEAEDTKILSSYIQSFNDSTRIELTLKLNKTDIGPVITSFQRRGLVIKGTFSQNARTDDSMDRYDQFMQYLNI